MPNDLWPVFAQHLILRIEVRLEEYPRLLVAGHIPLRQPRIAVGGREDELAAHTRHCALVHAAPRGTHGTQPRRPVKVDTNPAHVVDAAHDVVDALVLQQAGEASGVERRDRVAFDTDEQA